MTITTRFPPVERLQSSSPPVMAIHGGGEGGDAAAMEPTIEASGIEAIAPHCHGAIKHLLFFSTEESKLRHYRRIKVAASLLRGTTGDMKSTGGQTKSQRVNLRRIFEFSRALLSYKESPRDKTISLWVVETLVSYSYPIASFIGDEDMLREFGALAHDMVYMVLELHEKLFKMFQSLAYPEELSLFLMHVGLQLIPQVWKSSQDKTKILFRARQQLGHLLNKIRESDPDFNLRQRSIPSYPFLSRFFSAVLTVEYLHGSPDLAIQLLRDVLESATEHKIDVTSVKSFLRERVRGFSGNIAVQIAEVSAAFWAFLRMPTISELDVAHKGVLGWVLEGYGRQSCANGGHDSSRAPTPPPPPCLGAIRPQLVPAITYLSEEILRSLKDVQITSSLKYSILDHLISVMLDVPMSKDDEMRESVGTTLDKVVREMSKSTVGPLESTLKCSLGCFWHTKQAYLKDSDDEDKAFCELLCSFLSSITPVLDLTPSEVSCMNSMLCGLEVDAQMVKKTIPWVGSCDSKYRPFVSAVFTLERSNCTFAPLDISQTVVRIAAYENTLKALGISFIYRKLCLELESVFMYQIRRLAFNDGVSSVEGKLTILVCNSMDYLSDPACSLVVEDWILEFVQKFLMDYEQLCWNRACSIHMMKLSTKKKKLYMWWFNRLVTNLHPDVVIALLCTAFYSESDFAFGKTNVDKGRLEEEMHLFRESLMKKIFESISIKHKDDKKIARLVMQALSFDRVHLINQMKVVFSLDWPKTIVQFDEEVQKILQYEGLNMKGIDLALASLRLARPIISELSNRVLKDSKNDYIYSDQDTPITEESTASVFKDHKPWNIHISKTCSKKKEQTLFANIRRNWITVLENNSTTNGLDGCFFYGVCARMIRIFTADIQAWKGRISNLQNIEDILSSCIDFCLERHEISSLSCEDIRKRIATLTLTWLHQGCDITPCLCSGTLNGADDAEAKSPWDKPYFEQAATLSENVEFLLAMKLLEMDYRHSQVWLKPSDQKNHQFSLVDTSAHTMTTKLWEFYPEFARLGLRYYNLSDANMEVLARLIISHCNDPLVQSIPEYAEIMLKYKDLFPTVAPFHALDHWAPTSPNHFVEYFHINHPCVERYIVKCMEQAPIESTKFVIPQIIQCLRYEECSQTVQKVLMKASRKDAILAAYIYWQLNGERTPPEEAFNPVIKRSGWNPPEDAGLWKVSDTALSKLIAGVPDAIADSVKCQVSYFNKIYEVASYLGSVAKEDRIMELRNKLKEIEEPTHPVYVPFYPDKFVESIDYGSCITLPSAAKIPILVFFNTRTAQGKVERVGCIFKVGDDCRQDVLALQVIAMLEETFKDIGLDLFLYTYGVITTGYEMGLIEVVPNTKSRSGLGELSDCGLMQIFKQNFGEPGSETFESARQNFIRSCAGYAVTSFILWAKDRHNGNMLIDKDGHLIHIDFGFIFGISPGGNLGFENAGFKLSHEMCQLIDPLGNRKSKEYKYFKKICIRGFLAARRRSADIIDCVSLMAKSGLPCFGYGKPVENLKKRLGIDLSTNEAAAYFESVVDDAYMKWTTGFYDVIQFLQQGIPK